METLVLQEMQILAPCKYGNQRKPYESLEADKQRPYESP